MDKRVLPILYLIIKNIKKEFLKKLPNKIHAGPYFLAAVYWSFFFR